MNEDEIKIAIIGVGPSGGILASFLSQKHTDVFIVDVWKDHLEAIKKNGLEIIGKTEIRGKFDKKNCLGHIRELKEFKPNIVFIAVKTTFLQKVISDLHENLGPDIYVISYQNGIGTEHEIAKVFGEKNSLRAVINYAGNIKAPGIIDMTFFNPPNYIGCLHPESEGVAKMLAKIMSNSGLLTEFNNEIQIKVWQKAILNSTLSGICAITQMTMQEAMSFEETYHIVSNVLKESIHVANVYGITISEEFHDIGLNYLSKGGHHKPSMLIDIENRRQTEVLYLNTKIVELARNKNIKVPFNEAISSFISGLDFINKNIQNYIKIKVEEYNFNEDCVFCSYVKDCIDSFTFCPLKGINIPEKALATRK